MRPLKFPDGREVWGGYRGGTYFWRFRNAVGEWSSLKLSESAMKALIHIYMLLLRDRT